MTIATESFLNARKGDQFIGKNELTWIVEGSGIRGGMLCKNPHGGENDIEEIFLRKGKLLDREGYLIEEFAEKVLHVPCKK